MLENFLADQLALAVAVGGEDDPIATLERGGDRFQLGGLVALGRGLSGVEAVRLQQHARPAFPRGLDFMGLGQSQKVSLGWQDLPEALAERRAKVASLAGLLGDDENRHRRQPDPNLLMCQSRDGKYPDSTSRRAARVKSRSRRAGRPALSTTRSSRTEGGGPELARIRIDTITGMAFSSLVSLAIVFATAARLHAHGVTDIATSAQAAEALRPIAGEFAFALFAAGSSAPGCWRCPC